MASSLTGLASGPEPLHWADVHAAWGLLGGALVLLASVGQVVLPMFQAVPAQPERRQAAWTVAAYAALLALAAFTALDRSDTGLPLVAACAAAWALSMLIRQSRTPLRRAARLRLAWIGGPVALLGATLVPVSGAPATLVGAVVLALGLPLPVMAMLLEIAAFLGWIGLQRRTPRSRRVPAVQVLLPARRRALALAALAAGAHGLVLIAMLGMWRRVSRFLEAAAST
jgi:hypothetical protein